MSKLTSSATEHPRDSRSCLWGGVSDPQQTSPCHQDLHCCPAEKPAMLTLGAWEQGCSTLLVVSKSFPAQVFLVLQASFWLPLLQTLPGIYKLGFFFSSHIQLQIYQINKDLKFLWVTPAQHKIPHTVVQQCHPSMQSFPPSRGEMCITPDTITFLLCHHHWFYDTQILQWQKAVQSPNTAKNLGNFILLKQKNKDRWSEFEPPAYHKTSAQKIREYE